MGHCLLIKKILILFAGCFLAGLFIGGKFGYWPTFVAGMYALMSTVTLLVYKWDKHLAMHITQASTRVPERSLHILALCCGWPGALLAQQWFRHKSKKRRFIVILWFIIVLNLVLFIAGLLYLRPLISAL